MELTRAQLVETMVVRYGYTFEHANRLDMDASILRHMSLIELSRPRGD